MELVYRHVLQMYYVLILKPKRLSLPIRRIARFVTSAACTVLWMPLLFHRKRKFQLLSRGVNIINRLSKYSILLTGLVIYSGLPLLFYALGDSPRRDALKESFSLLFILAFSLMLGLFFLSRSNRQLMHDIKMHKVVSIHKFIAYFAVGIFMLHPILLVVPRYFEASVNPLDAFWEIFTSFDNVGIILGIIAYALMLILGITSLLRNRLPFRYTTWRLFHGITVMVFVVAATWHVILLGRHIDLAMTIFLLFLAFLSLTILMKTYLLNTGKERTIK